MLGLQLGDEGGQGCGVGVGIGGNGVAERLAALSGASEGCGAVGVAQLHPVRLCGCQRFFGAA